MQHALAVQTVPVRYELRCQQAQQLAVADVYCHWTGSGLGSAGTLNFRKQECIVAPIHCRSFYYAGVFQGGLELFFAQLVNGQLPDGGLFDRFLIQCMLFHHAVLTCPSYKGTSGSFELTSAARAQVSLAALFHMTFITMTVMPSV